eukprot:1157222-Pelagomonas_calceolata.AAC.16
MVHKSHQLHHLVPDLVLPASQLHHHLLRLIELLGAVGCPCAAHVLQMGARVQGTIKSNEWNNEM